MAAQADQISIARDKGFYEISKKTTREDFSDILGEVLERRLGEPQKSEISPSRYYYTGNGRSIRLSNHTPVYFFEDSGLNVVAHATAREGQFNTSDITIWPGDYVNIPALAERLVEMNNNLPSVNPKKAKKRVAIKEAESEDARFLTPDQIKARDPEKYAEAVSRYGQDAFQAPTFN